MNKDWISASEVEKYGYCPLSWWLSREHDEEIENERLEKGEEQHKELGKEFKNLREEENRIQLIENVILGLAILTTIVSIFGMSFLTSDIIFSNIFIVLALIWILAATFFLYIGEKHKRKMKKTEVERTVLIFAMVATMLSVFSFSVPFKDPTIAQIAQIISLSWLIGASYWLKHSLEIETKAEQKRKDLNLEDGEIKYVDDLEKETKLLKSEEYGLRGRPDVILKKNGRPVPVEVKTGRVPKGPFFSHILQIAAYCLLVEEDIGETPPYGIIRYGETEFEIDYDSDLKNLLIGKLEAMRKHLENQNVHRNHNREGKCRNCSRREICSETLV
ncbi:MAG: CRISPR-associated protein Cas4 [Candidatus Natronoplasma sp.]